MDPLITSAIAGGGASIIGNLIGGNQSAKASIRAAREQMAFQERMSSTAHQREVEDLRKAGINPILSAKHGGASSPGGALATVPDYSQIGSQAVGSAQEAVRTKKTMELLDLEKQSRQLDNMAKSKQNDLLEIGKRVAAAEADVKGLEAFSARRILEVKQAWPKTTKALDLVMPYVSQIISTARDAAITGRAIQGFGNMKAVVPEPRSGNWRNLNAPLDPFGVGRKSNE